MLRLDTSLACTLFCLIGLACAGAEVEPDDTQLTREDLSPAALREAQEPADEGEVVAPDELPAELRSILDAWHQGGFVWEIKRSEVLSDPAETDFLVNNLVLLLFDEAKAMRRATTASEADPTQRPALTRVMGELELCGQPAALALAETLGLGDDLLAELALDALMQMGPVAAPAVAGLLDRKAALVRYQALDALARLPGAGPDEPGVRAALARVAREDRSSLVRVAAVRTLGERGLFSQAGRPAGAVELGPWARAIEACLDDPEQDVRLEALSALANLGEPSAVPAVIDFGAQASGPGQTAARKTLESLTGEHFGTRFADWKSWWTGQSQGDGN